MANSIFYVNSQVLQFLYFWIWPILIWSAIWKGIALWKAARLGNKAWFVVLLVVNTVGVLEILYIYWFSKKSRKES